MVDFKLLQLKARDQVYTLLSGRHLASLYGEGYDFAELREYQYGDDIRKINWTISAKLGKPYLKELHANRELSVVVATLMDGSLYFDADNTKAQTLLQTAMLLGYATQHYGDLFTGVGYTHDRTYTTPPTKQGYTITHFFHKLSETTLLHTRLNPQEAIDDLFVRIPRRSLLFVIGDFLESVDLSLLAQKHEVIAIVVRHHHEEHPKAVGEVELEDPRGGAKRRKWLNQSAIESYQRHYLQHDSRLQAHCARYGIRFLKITTDQEPIVRLLQLF